MTPTKTDIYLYPALYYGYDTQFQNVLRGLRANRVIVNSYLGDVTYNKPSPPYSIFILTDFRQFVSAEKLLSYLSTHPSYIDSYSCGDYSCVIIFRIPDKRAYNQFILSRFSQMYSKEFLEKNFRKSNGQYLNVYHVLAKTERRKQELMDYFNIHSYTWDADEYEDSIDLLNSEMLQPSLISV